MFYSGKLSEASRHGSGISTSVYGIILYSVTLRLLLLTDLTLPRDIFVDS
jgi:hypothetical protein